MLGPRVGAGQLQGGTRFAEGFGQGGEADGGSACPTATAAAAAAADPASEVNFCVRSPSSPGENRERNETFNESEHIKREVVKGAVELI